MFSASQEATMDWAGAIELNREALKAIVATLFAMLGLDREATTVNRLSHAFHRRILRILQPAESAVRRLVVIAARGLAVKPAPSRPAPSRPAPKGIIAKGGQSNPPFKLFDPRKRFTTTPQKGPRIHIFSYDPTVAAIFAARARTKPAPQRDDGLINSQRLVHRLQALKSALDNLPRQAKRLVRARLRRDKIPSLRLKSPLRPGPPPGHRKVKIHEIDDILAECHALAWDALRLDTG
jgi:hypothetical protein